MLSSASAVARATPWVSVHAPCFTLEVLGVSGDDLLYEPSSNAETSDSIGAACP